MRVLCTCVPSHGRLFPMVPLAHALVKAGHDVAFATAREFHPEVAHAGFQAFSTGLSLTGLREEVQRRFPEAQAMPADQQAALMFTQVAPRATLADLLPVARDWRPALIIHEEGEFAGPVAATLLDVPRAQLGWPAPMRTPARLRLLESSLVPLWMDSGVANRPVEAMHRYLQLDSCPPSLQAAHAAAEGNLSRPLRPVLYDAASKTSIPILLEGASSKPTVYVTLGTVPTFNEAPAIFKVLLDGLRNEALNVIVTVGENNDPAILGPQPEHVYVERYVPQTLLLSHCDVVICHGGPGSTIGALSHGLPLLMLPRGGAVQRRNAMACAKAGVGRVIDDELVPESVRRHVWALLDERKYRLAAQGVAEEIRQMPGPQEAVGVLEHWESLTEGV